MNTDSITTQVKSKVANLNPYREEGKLAKAIESQTSRIPSDAFLWAAGGFMIASIALKVMEKKHTALFVGQWVAPTLLLGIYNKIVKVHGHDQLSDLPT